MHSTIKLRANETIVAAYERDSIHYAMTNLGVLWYRDWRSKNWLVLV